MASTSELDPGRATRPSTGRNPSTWGPALDGVEAAYVVYYPDLALPGGAEAIRAFGEQAVAAGAKRLVLLSGRGEEEGLVAEIGVQTLGVDWTVVRSSWINQNFSEGFLLDEVLSGEVVLPLGSLAEPFVDADDIADVAVAALTEPGHSGLLYELSGPRLLTIADVAADLSEVTGRDITYAPVTTEQFAEALAAEEMLPDMVEAFTDLFARVLDGRNAHLTDGVQRALGREPKDFREFAKAAAATGVWDV